MKMLKLNFIIENPLENLIMSCSDKGDKNLLLIRLFYLIFLLIDREIKFTD